MSQPRVALATAAAMPDMGADERLVLAPLAAHGVRAETVVWDDARVDWGVFDLVVVCSVGDYGPRFEEFTAWAESVPRLVNSATTIRWNTAGSCLRELALTGRPVVETMWLEPDSTLTLPTRGLCVVGPAIGWDSRDTVRYDLGSPGQRALAAGHATRLGTGGRPVLLRPFPDMGDGAGETSLVFFGGVYSHAIHRGSVAGTSAGPGTRGPFGEETIAPHEPSTAERDTARGVLGHVPGGPLVYARVDLVPGRDGAPVLSGLELIRPALFLGFAPGAAERFADAITAALP